MKASSLVLLLALTSSQSLFSQEAKPKEGFVANTETAVKIGEAVLEGIYGRGALKKEQPFTGSLKNGIWTVAGTPYPEMIGSVAFVEIVKQDGKILRAGRNTTPVTLTLDHGRLNPSGDPSFLVSIGKWEPKSTIDIFLVGPKGETVQLSTPTVFMSDNEGSFTLMISYLDRRLYPGTWIIFAAGANSGGHQKVFEIPKVISGKGSGIKYRLKFASGKDLEVR